MVKSIFNILGPIMIGPSSSHTAGAEKLGHAANVLANGDIDFVTFTLYGSFLSTGKGHGTDKALLAGVMAISAKDERLKKAYEIAESRGLKFKFCEGEANDIHPNTVMIEIVKSDKTSLTLVGCSIGGGNILINSINNIEANVNGEYAAVIIKHLDRVGVVSKITALLEQYNINIVTLKNNREAKGKNANTVIETDTLFNNDIIGKFKTLPYIIDIIVMDKLV